MKASSAIKLRGTFEAGLAACVEFLKRVTGDLGGFGFLESKCRRHASGRDVDNPREGSVVLSMRLARLS